LAKRYDKSCKIISNKRVCADYFELKVKFGGTVKCVPGQFFMLTVPGVFLRRPLSVHDAKNGMISFLYKVAGKGTKLLSEIKSGEIKVLGPLGNGYPLTPHSKLHPPHSVIVAGGTGIASVHFLAAKLKSKGTLYYGARSEKDLLCLDKFKKLGWKILISTEDGSKGYKGFVTDLLRETITNYELRITNKKPLPSCRAAELPSCCLYVCGPTPMMKAVLKIAKEKNISGFASLEEKMACGIGNCQGCAVKINGEYKMTCKEGPVFKIGEIEL